MRLSRLDNFPDGSHVDEVGAVHSLTPQDAHAERYCSSPRQPVHVSAHDEVNEEENSDGFGARGKVIHARFPLHTQRVRVWSILEER